MKLTTEIPNSAGCAVEAMLSGPVRTGVGSAVSIVAWFGRRVAPVSVEDEL
jgi:hypothetical protein